MVSILLLGSAFLIVRAPGGGWGEPVGMACIWFSALFGALAAREGSKWWLVIPVSIVVCVVLGFVLVSLSRE